MQVLLVEPFYGGSHRQWADGFKANSRHDIALLTLSGHHWKWRMHGGAVTLARRFLEQGLQPDVIFATDMLDLTTFLALTRYATHQVPVALYMHESQFIYPWSAKDRDKSKGRDHHYSFINYTNTLAADQIFFNSEYHMDAYLAELPRFLRAFPEPNDLLNVERIEAKSSVLPIGLDLARFDRYKAEAPPREGPPVIGWNHRWEHDKEPDIFFKSLERLDATVVDFRLVVLGERYDKYPPVFDRIRDTLKHRLLHWGFVDSFEDYANWLCRCDLLPVTSNQDFFGISVVEAMYCNVYPLLPDRLAFPGHIPEALRPLHLYPGTQPLAPRLASLLKDPNTIRQTRTEHLVSRYDWGILAPQYDQMLEGMVRK